MGRIAVVTGGTKGIGACISKALKEEGYTVIANYFLREDIAQDFQEATGIDVMKWNVADYDSCMNAIEQIEAKYSQNVEILINNAGATSDSPFYKMTKEDWYNVLHVNLDSCFHMTRAVINQMHKNKFGRIVNISSINDKAEITGQTNYTTSKAALIGFTKALAEESASKNITVNAVLPGYIMSDLAAEKVPSQILEKITHLIPMAKLGRPEDVSNAVLFLVGDKAGYITGETISVNGGKEILN